eukprot:1920178-Rhodomonas_salina.7
MSPCEWGCGLDCQCIQVPSRLLSSSHAFAALFNMSVADIGRAAARSAGTGTSSLRYPPSSLARSAMRGAELGFGAARRVKSATRKLMAAAMGSLPRIVLCARCVGCAVLTQDMPRAGSAPRSASVSVQQPARRRAGTGLWMMARLQST